MLRITLAACLAIAGLAAQTVEVRVFNPSTGAGIPDFPLRFMQYGQTLYSGATDAGGRFRIESAKEGPYTVLYERGKYWPAQDSHLIGGSIALQVSGGAEPTHLDIGMYPMARISGRVLDGAGKPVAKARINLSDETPRGQGRLQCPQRRRLRWSRRNRPPISSLAGPTPIIRALPAANLRRRL
jgi:hypothetical protein